MLSACAPGIGHLINPIARSGQDQDPSNETIVEGDLDDVQNKALHPVFQTTLQTSETSAVVSELEDDEEKSRRKAVLFKYLVCVLCVAAVAKIIISCQVLLWR